MYSSNSAISAAVRLLNLKENTKKLRFKIFSFVSFPFNNQIGTLINRKTVLTAGLFTFFSFFKLSCSFVCDEFDIDVNNQGHCLLREYDYDYLNGTYKIKVVPNMFYPTYESIFTVYVGADRIIEDDVDLKPAQPKHVEKAIAVSVD